MAGKVNGITIAINADTNGVTAGLKDVTSESVALAKQLKSVESLLKLDPENTELLATKQKLLADSVDASRRKLDALRAAQDDVKKAVASGSIGTEEYLAFQREIVQTEKRLRDLSEQEKDTGDQTDALEKDVKEASAEMQKAGDESGKLGDALKSGLAKGAEIAAGAVAAMAAAAAATVTAVVDLTAQTAEYGDNIDKTSQKLGMSAQAYQEWDFIMQHSGSDIDKMTTSMKTLSKAVVDQSDKSVAAFAKLGISMEDAANMSQEELFAATISALQGMDSGAERTALAVDLLGKSAMELGPLLNTSAEDTEKMRQQVHELGGVMSDEAVKASAAYQDSLQNAKTAAAGFGREIGTKFMPAITQMMDGFSALASGNADAAGSIEAGADQFLSALSQTADRVVEIADRILPLIGDAIVRALPKLIETAAEIVSQFAGSMLRSLPKVVKAGTEIVTNLVQTLLKALPEILRTGISVIAQLAKGIADALPTLVPTIINIALEIVDILTDPATLGTLIDASLAIILALSDGIIESMPTLIERLPELIGGIVTGIAENLPKLLEAAVAIVTSICEYLFTPENADQLLTAAMEICVKIAKGIGDAIWKITEKVAEIAKEIADKLGIGEYWEAGADVIEQFMGGVQAKWEEWRDWWEGFGEYLYDFLHPDFSGESMIDESAVWQPPEPAMAVGGIVTRPTRALIGENGAEAILPLDRNTGWMDRLAAKIGGGGITIGNVQITVPAGSDGRQIARDFVAELDTQLRNHQIAQQRGIGGTAWPT